MAIRQRIALDARDGRYYHNTSKFRDNRPIDFHDERIFLHRVIDFGSIQDKTVSGNMVQIRILVFCYPVGAGVPPLGFRDGISLPVLPEPTCRRPLEQ